MGQGRQVVGGAVLALLLAGCLPTPSPWLGASGVHVGVVGDSLIHHAEFDRAHPESPRQLSADLVDSGHRVSLSSAVGADTPDLGAIASFPDPGADLLVIGLGTNDMNRELPIPTSISNIEAFIGAIAPRCTVVITVVDEPSWGLQELGPLYNEALVDLATERGDVVVADWLSLVHEHPEYLGTDGVHHTELGREAYRALIVAGVADCQALVPARPC